MKWVKPKVYIIAATALHSFPAASFNTIEGIRDYLQDIGAPDWDTNSVTGGETVIEMGGRLCYRAFGTDLNLNLTKVREGNLEYLQNIIKQGHGSVLEHSSITFIFRNVSRVFTHELVRHRVGVAISQESLRYVALDDIPMTLVNDGDVFCDAADEEDHSRRDQFWMDFTMLVKEQEKFITKWRNRLISPNSKMACKKKVTSLLRRAAPIGLATSIMWTANLRAIRHVLELRTTLGAEAEIRCVFNLVGELMKKAYPAVFDDFEVTPEKEWKPLRSKV